MTNLDFINLYKLNKVGLYDSLNKRCLCGKEVGVKESVCPDCGTKLTNTKLINVNKNTAISKRIETIDGDICSFKVYELYSKGFELYETLYLDFTVDKKTLKVDISNSKAFKNIEKYKEFEPFMEKNIPNFLAYVKKCLSLVGGSYVASSFSGLSADFVANMLNVHLNYSALEDYLIGHKVLYFGGKIDLKDSLDIDYNSDTEVTKSGLLLPLLKTWDIKNLKYFESIVELSKMSNAVLKVQICDIADELFEKLKRDRWYFEDNLKNYFSIFSLLYNKEITPEDFVRLYNKSSQECFEQLYAFRTLYKKHISKSIDWSEINRFTEKNVGTLFSKDDLKKVKISKECIEEIYSELEKNPLKALELLSAQKKEE